MALTIFFVIMHNRFSPLRFQWSWHILSRTLSWVACKKF